MFSIASEFNLHLKGWKEPGFSHYKELYYNHYNYKGEKDKLIQLSFVNIYIIMHQQVLNYC